MLYGKGTGTKEYLYYKKDVYIFPSPYKGMKRDERGNVHVKQSSVDWITYFTTNLNGREIALQNYYKKIGVWEGPVSYFHLKDFSYNGIPKYL